MAIWNVTWVSFYGAAAGVQAGLALVLDDDDDKAVYGVGAARAAIAAAAIPLIGVRTRGFERSGQLCADLEAAEGVLATNVRLHAKGRKWVKHAGVIGLNAAAFLTLGLGFDLWARGALGLGIGLVMGEVQIYTQPMGSRSISGRLERPVALLPTVSENGAGLALAGVF